MNEYMTCLNALEEKIWKSDQKVVMDEKINPNDRGEWKNWFNISW